MPNPVNIETVKELNEVFSKAKSAVLADYKGIDAASMTALRALMRSRSVEFRVVKNRLANLAAKNTSFEVLDGSFKGPVSMVLSFEDPLAPAKVLAEHAKENAKATPKVICGVLEGKKVTPEDVKALAALPSKEQLLSQLLATFQGPATGFVGVFSSLLRKLVGAMDAIREKRAGE